MLELLWSKTLSVPSFGSYWKQLIGRPYSNVIEFSFIQPSLSWLQNVGKGGEIFNFHVKKNERKTVPFSSEKRRDKWQKLIDPVLSDQISRFFPRFLNFKDNLFYGLLLNDLTFVIYLPLYALHFLLMFSFLIFHLHF